MENSVLYCFSLENYYLLCYIMVMKIHINSMALKRKIKEGGSIGSFCSCFGYSRGTINRLMIGNPSTSLDLATRLAKDLNCRLSDIVLPSLDTETVCADLALVWGGLSVEQKQVIADIVKKSGR